MQVHALLGRSLFGFFLSFLISTYRKRPVLRSRDTWIDEVLVGKWNAGCYFRTSCLQKQRWHDAGGKWLLCFLGLEQEFWGLCMHTLALQGMSIKQDLPLTTADMHMIWEFHDSECDLVMSIVSRWVAGSFQHSAGQPPKTKPVCIVAWHAISLHLNITHVFDSQTAMSKTLLSLCRCPDHLECSHLGTLSHP